MQSKVTTARGFRPTNTTSVIRSSRITPTNLTSNLPATKVIYSGAVPPPIVASNSILTSRLSPAVQTSYSVTRPLGVLAHGQTAVYPLTVSRVSTASNKYLSRKITNFDTSDAKPTPYLVTGPVHTLAVDEPQIIHYQTVKTSESPTYYENTRPVYQKVYRPNYVQERTPRYEEVEDEHSQKGSCCCWPFWILLGLLALAGLTLGLLFGLGVLGKSSGTATPPANQTDYSIPVLGEIKAQPPRRQPNTDYLVPYDGSVKYVDINGNKVDPTPATDNVSVGPSTKSTMAVKPNLSIPFSTLITTPNSLQTHETWVEGSRNHLRVSDPNDY